MLIVNLQLKFAGNGVLGRYTFPSVRLVKGTLAGGNRRRFGSVFVQVQSGSTGEKNVVLSTFSSRGVLVHYAAQSFDLRF